MLYHSVAPQSVSGNLGSDPEERYCGTPTANNDTFHFLETFCLNPNTHHVLFLIGYLGFNKKRSVWDFQLKYIQYSIKFGWISNQQILEWDRAQRQWCVLRRYSLYGSCCFVKLLTILTTGDGTRMGPVVTEVQ